MKDEQRTKAELIRELQSLRRRTANAETTQRRCKQVEVALRESEGQYRTLVEAAPDVVYTISAQRGLLTSLNPAFEAITGWSRAEWLGKPFMGLVHPDDLSAAVETFQKTLRGEAPPVYELRILSKSGEYLVGEFTSTPLMIGGKVKGELGIGRDITKRKQAEETAALLAQTIRSVDECVSITGLDNRIRFVNEAFLRTYGYTAQEVVGKPISLFRSAATEPKLDTIANATIQGGWHGELVNRRKDGTEFQIALSTSVVRDDDGKPVALVGVAQDITERKRAEAVLRLSEERFSAAFKHSPLMMTISSVENGRYISVNDEFVRVSGFSGEEAVGKTSIELGWLLPQDRARLVQVLRTQGRVAGMELTLHSKDHHRIECLYNGELIIVGGKPCLLSLAQDITERKRAEEALRESEERFRKVFEESPIGMVLTSRDLRFVSANPAFCRLLGYTAEEISTKTFLELTHPDHRDTDRENVEKMWQGKIHHYRTEKRYVAKNGTIHWGNLATSLIKGDGGAPIYALVMIEDVTERKQAEEARKRTEALLQNVLSNAPITIFAVDRQGNFILSDGKGLEGAGLKPGQNVGVSALDLYGSTLFVEHKGDRTTGGEVLRRALAGETVKAVNELRGICFDNHIGPICDEEGKVVGVVGVATDITERKRAEEALGESEQKYRTLFENMAQGAFYQRADGVVVDGNPAVLEIFGLTRDQFLGRTAMDSRWKVIHEDGSDFPGEQHPSMGALRTGKPVRGVVAGVFNPRKDDYVWLNISAIPQFKAGEDRPYQVFVTLHDITERKRAEEALKSAKNRLQFLSHRLLRAREDDRRALARELHDEIGQILTAAKIDLQMMEQKPVPTEIAERIRANITTLDLCLQQIRNLSLDLHPSMLDDLGLVAALRWHLDRRAQRVGFRIQLSVSGNVQRLHSDLETACYRIVQEALTNAERHAQATLVLVKLRFSERELYLEVRDDGVGFEPKQILQGASFGKTLGMIGMQERAALAGGELQIKSAPNHGSSVEVTFPLQASA